MAAAAQSAATTALDFTLGSVLRALLQAVASVQLWLQYLILAVLQQAFLTSATGAQVDNWLAQFPLFGGRLGATYATGSVTFSRYTSVASALIPPGSLVRTADGTQTFTIVADTTNPLWSAAQSGYLLPAGTASATVPVQAVVAGAGANVAANTITQIVGSLPGIDTVNNAAAFTNGENQESDDAVKARFKVWQSNIATGTYGAVQAAAEGVQANLSLSIAMNQDTTGAYTPGTFVVTVDDGSGDTPSSTIDAVANAVNNVRPVGSTAFVVAATAILANVSMVISVGAGYSKSAAQAAVQAAISSYIGALAVGVPMPYSILAKLAFDAYSGITNVTAITLNGSTSDLAPSNTQVVRSGSIAIN